MGLEKKVSLKTGSHCGFILVNTLAAAAVVLICILILASSSPGFLFPSSAPSKIAAYI